MGLSCLHFHISSEIVPSSSMWTFYSMSACRNVPGMSVTAMYLPSLAQLHMIA